MPLLWTNRFRTLQLAVEKKHRQVNMNTQSKRFTKYQHEHVPKRKGYICLCSKLVLINKSNFASVAQGQQKGNRGTPGIKRPRGRLPPLALFSYITVTVLHWVHFASQVSRLIHSICLVISVTFTTPVIFSCSISLKRKLVFTP